MEAVPSVVKFYMDVHVPRAVTTALRLRGIDVITAQQDGSGALSDNELLLRAASLRCIMVSQDDDIFREGARFQHEGIEFAGVVYAHQMAVSIGQMVEDLTLIAKSTDASEWVDRIVYLPL